MIPWTQAIQKSSLAHTGIANAYLLDVEDPNGNCYYWGSRPLVAPSVIVGDGGSASNLYLPWILSAPQFTFNRSMKTDSGSVQLQNLSGDTLQSDFQKIARRTVLEGALCVYREWNAGGQAAELEFHGTLSVDDSNPEKVSLTLKQLNDPSQDAAPPYQLCEICQWRWSSVQCGSTQPTPCMQTFPTCQVVERVFVIVNNYEKNYGEAWANTATGVVNRIRQF
ncbi:MAG TPA: hypothetical protein VHX37_13550 [Acidobacteriaceae bacterium]|jgi:hypothetical protein|nr:hypothetical protein [Acidobacteriaceae bacterium]